MSSSCPVCESKVDLRACSKCKIVKYCSKAHQKEDWATHKQVCKTPVNPSPAVTAPAPAPTQAAVARAPRLDPCQVCGPSVEPRFSSMITCSICGIQVHTQCYGYHNQDKAFWDVSRAPWTCHRCEFIEEAQLSHDSKQVACICCPIQTGVFKPMLEERRRWCHILCAEWPSSQAVQHEFGFHYDKETGNWKWIMGNPNIDLLNMICEACGTKGTCIQCAVAGCGAMYHPICAKKLAWEGRVRMQKGRFNPGQLFCEQHVEATTDWAGFRGDRRRVLGSKELQYVQAEEKATLAMCAELRLGAVPNPVAVQLGHVPDGSPSEFAQQYMQACSCSECGNGNRQQGHN